MTHFWKKNDTLKITAGAGFQIFSPPLTNLDFWANFNRFFKSSEGTECSNSLPTNSLQLSKFPATATSILQNALSILPNLRDEHQGSGENLL